MNEEIQLCLEKSDECLSDAQYLLNDSRMGGAVARAYYAMFHAATAVLLTKNIERTSHKAVISAFGEFVVKPSLTDKKFQRYFLETFELRQESDYLTTKKISGDQAKESLRRAVEFVNVCKDMCK